MTKRTLPKRASTGSKIPDRLLAVLMKQFIWRFGFGVIVCTLVFAASITRIANPALQSEHMASPTVSYASLSFSDAGVQINGSVEQLFQSPSFVGPTSNQKRSRLLPTIDVLKVASTFVAERTRIAALRSAQPEPTDISQTSSSVLQPATQPDTTATIALATIDPSLTSSALSAIDEVTPLDPSIPLPSILSDQLAYSRANTPTTERAVSQYSERERWCLATGIYFEARGETYRGQVGVAQVIMNRVKHRQYPDTICGVVFQNQSWKNRCQFSFACDGIPERVNDSRSWDTAMEITEKVTSGSIYLSEVANATHYHANYVYPHWAPRMTRLTRIGLHIFYRFRS